MNKGKVFIISGPSGVGKDTVIQGVLPRLNNFFLSVSLTTRSPRQGETDGIDYFFVTEEYFKQQVKDNKMLEYADFCTVCYGTPRPPVEQALNQGKNVILKIERDGMLQAKKIYPDAVTIFIAPPSVEVLKHRILKRNTDTAQAIEKRLNRALYEIEKSSDYQYTVVNGELETAVDELEKLLKM